MSFHNPTNSSQLSAKRPRTELRLPLHDGLRDLTNIKLQDLENVSPEVTVQNYGYLEANSLFQAFRPGYLDLQERFLILRKHRAAHSEHWLQTHVTPENRSSFKMPSAKVARFLRTFADIREAAHASNKLAVAEAAAIYEACAAASLVSSSASAVEVLDNVPDIRQRFSVALTYLEARAPHQSLGVSSAARRNIGTQTVAVTNPPPTVTSLPLDLGLSDNYLRQRISDYRDPIDDQNLAAWHDICGVDAVKSKLDMKIALMLHADKIATPYKQLPGILLYGPTGTGKSSLVASFAKRYDLPMYSVASSIKGKLQGETEKLLQLIFKEVRANQPCVLFFDEADALIHEPAAKDAALAGFMGVLKTEWSNLIQSGAKVFVFGASNRPWDIPSEGFSRRFDELIYMGLPDVKARQELFKMSLKDHHTISERQMKELGEAADGYTGWDIRQAVETARDELAAELVAAQAWHKVKTNQGERLFPAPLKQGQKPVGLADIQVTGSTLISPRPLSFDTLRQYFDPMSGKLRRKTVNASSIDQYRKWADKAQDR